jgi:hypothetical protein
VATVAAARDQDMTFRNLAAEIVAATNSIAFRGRFADSYLDLLDAFV